jgi:tetratricopeptide (TPR) repeat protein
MESGKLTQAEEVLDTAIEWAARVGDRRTELNAALERTALRLFSRPEDAELLLAVVDEAIPVLADLGDDKALAKAWYLVGLSRGLWRCRFGEGELALGRALQHARRAQDRRQEAEILANLGYAAWAGPTAVPEAIASCERMLATAEGHPSMEAAALRSLAALKARRGDFEDARQLLARAAGIYTELGMSLRAVAVNAFGYGDIEMLAGDPVSAEQRLREGYGSLEGMGDKGYLSAVAAFLSQALYAQSLYAAAEEFTVVAEKTSSSNDIWPQVLIRATRAKVRAQHAEYGQGEALAREALALASPTDWLEMKAGALLDLAEVLQLAGRTEAASPLIEQAVVHYERKGNVVLAEKARKRLQEVVTA